MNPPLEFRCPSCQQRLTAKAEKAGRRVKCPRCGGSLVVPVEEEPLPPPVHDRAFPPVLSPIIDDSDLPVIVLGEELASPAPKIHLSEPFDPTWVSFPRRLIYIHAALLAIALAGAFGLGYWVGRDPPPKGDSSPAQTWPIALDGRVTWIGPFGEQAGDDGAVVMAFPRARRPGRTEKPSLAGLGPTDPSPAENDPVIEAIAAQGGAYFRADGEGSFRLVLPRPGEYYLLFLSRHATRPDGDQVRREHLAEMGEYFTAALELIGPQQYSWSLRDLDADSDISHAFQSLR